jgi:hypothetical protein
MSRVVTEKRVQTAPDFDAILGKSKAYIGKALLRKVGGDVLHVVERPSYQAFVLMKTWLILMATNMGLGSKLTSAILRNNFIVPSVTCFSTALTKSTMRT